LPARSVSEHHGRKRDEEDAGPEPEQAGIDPGEQHGSDRNADETSDDEGPQSRWTDRVPDRRDRLSLRHHRTDHDEGSRDPRLDHMQPDAERDETGAETGKARHEAAGERAEKYESSIMHPEPAIPSRRASEREFAQACSGTR
jgi:hypothetical protein